MRWEKGTMDPASHSKQFISYTVDGLRVTQCYRHSSPLCGSLSSTSNCGCGGHGGPEVVLVPVLDHLLQRICGCGEKVSAEITLHSWACLRPRCLRFLQQRCGATAPAPPGLDLIDSLLACGLDARAEHIWKSSQGRGGGERRVKGVLWEPDPNPCKTQGFPRLTQTGHPFPPRPHADGSGF